MCGWRRWCRRCEPRLSRRASRSRRCESIQRLLVFSSSGGTERAVTWSRRWAVEARMSSAIESASDSCAHLVCIVEKQRSGTDLRNGNGVGHGRRASRCSRRSSRGRAARCRGGAPRDRDQHRRHGDAAPENRRHEYRRCQRDRQPSFATAGWGRCRIVHCSSFWARGSSGRKTGVASLPAFGVGSRVLTSSAVSDLHSPGGRSTSRDRVRRPQLSREVSVRRE